MQCERIAYRKRLFSTLQKLCVYHRLRVVYPDLMLGPEAITSIRKQEEEKQHDNSEHPAVIMVFMKR